MIRYIFSLLLLAGCSIPKQVQSSTIIHKMASANVVTPKPHYHTIYWNPAIVYDSRGDNYGAVLEYDLYSTTNFTIWIKECTTTKTNAFVTNNYPQQYYRVAVHIK